MKRSLYLRLFIGILAVSLSFILLSYVRGRAARDEEPNGEIDKCSSGKAKTQYILWESLTHNLLIINF